LDQEEDKGQISNGGRTHRAGQLYAEAPKGPGSTSSVQDRRTPSRKLHRLGGGATELDLMRESTERRSKKVMFGGIAAEF